MNEELYKKVKESIEFYMEVDCICDSEQVCHVCNIAYDVASSIPDKD